MVGRPAEAVAPVGVETVVVREAVRGPAREGVSPVLPGAGAARPPPPRHVAVPGRRGSRPQRRQGRLDVPGPVTAATVPEIVAAVAAVATGPDTLGEDGAPEQAATVLLRRREESTVERPAVRATVALPARPSGRPSVALEAPPAPGGPLTRGVGAGPVAVLPAHAAPDAALGGQGTGVDGPGRGATEGGLSEVLPPRPDRVGRAAVVWDRRVGRGE